MEIIQTGQISLRVADHVAVDITNESEPAPNPHHSMGAETAVDLLKRLKVATWHFAQVSTWTVRWPMSNWMHHNPSYKKRLHKRRGITF